LAATAEILEARCLLTITSTTPIPITATETLSFSGNVMHFTADDNGPFSANIHWGDTTTSPGTITPSAGGGFDVSGTHTYAEDGPYTVTVNIIDDENDMASPTTTADVAEDVLSLGAVDFSGTENSALTNVVVANFSDPGSPDDGSAFTAMINWGDGTSPTAGTVNVVPDIPGSYTVTGTHTYFDEGSYTVTTSVDETGITDGAIGPVGGTASIGEADVLNNGVITLPSGMFVEGQPIPATTQVATFSDPGYPTNSASDFTALINWGDGSAPTAGTVVALGGGNFGVQGGHTYKEEGPYNVVVLAADDAPGTATITITGTVAILNAPLTGAAVALHGTEGAPLTNVDVATFIDADPLGDPNDFVATIDWGDGTVTAGKVIQDAQIPPGGGTSFHVVGSHTYTEEKATTYPVTVTITDRGDDDMWPLNSPFVTSTTVTSTAQIVQSPLLPVANSLVSTEGTAIAGGTQLATFTDTGGADPVGDYTAMLNWGDGSGTHPAGVIALGQGNFAVVSNGPFTYPDEGTFALTVSVTDADTTNNPGNVPTTAQTTALVIVNDAALTAAATQPTIPALNEGQPFSGAVSAFTDANTAATAADYTAQIDWGDGSPISLGSFVVGAGGAVTVDGTHTYKQDGAYTIRVVTHDDGGSVVTTTTMAVVGDPNLTGAAARPVRAVEGQDTGLVYLASFIDPDPNATLHDWNAVVHWGDGSADETATLVIAGGDPATGGTIFKVLADHTYAEEGPPTAPTVTLTDVDTPANTPTVLPLNITVVDAPLASSNGSEITGVEGTATQDTTVLGSFSDANPFATAADFLPTTAIPPGNGGKIVVNWGDTTAPETLGPGNITMNGSPNGVIFTITAGHDYVEEGTYQFTVTITDDGGSTTSFVGSAIIADAALTATAKQPIVFEYEPTIFPIPVFSPPFINAQPVAEFTDANPLPPTGSSSVADFTATIDWGDGTPKTAGTIVSVSTGTTATYQVLGSHTYADAGVDAVSGSYKIQVFVVDDGGSKLTIDNSATVYDNPLFVTGDINPKSVSGLSTKTLDVTNVNQPSFFGTAMATRRGSATPEAYAEVTLTATNTTTGTSTVLGTVQAGSGGAWKLKSHVVLRDGHYEITATSTDQFGNTVQVIPSTLVSDLSIDTVGPVIDGMFFNRLNGQVDYIIKDPLNPDGSAPAGVWVNTLLDSSNYLLTKVHANKAFPGKWIVTNVTATPDPKIPFAYDVAVTFNGGKIIHGGFYLITIRDSSDGNSSVQDLAENHLDGQFYGTFPSGNGIPGSDFIAELQSYHNKVFAPQTIEGTATAANGGVGGVPTNAVHSGVFVPLLPPGASPIFSTSTSVTTGDPPPAHKKATGQTVIKQKHGQSVHSNTNGKHTDLVLSKNHPKGPKHS
jgi:hypothetical protein